MKGEEKNRLNGSDSVDDVFANKQNDSVRGRSQMIMEDDAVACNQSHKFHKRVLIESHDGKFTVSFLLMK